ncbi:MULTISPECIES: hypothetical protein [unclassified Moorena]|nr:MULTISPECIES: hypothetical protein [unclassified Moorena]NEO11018.1 hypothetical protein [Moorena sp. SIO3E8]NEP99132.1 hypothetical protein [Moorena sp. SIO3F7]
MWGTSAGRWGDGKMGRWEDGEMGRWGDWSKTEIRILWEKVQLALK